MQAEAIALTVAQAFTMAYEDWDEKSKERQKEVEDEQANDAMELYKDLVKDTCKSNSSSPNEITEEGQTKETDFNFISNSLAPRIETIVSLCLVLFLFLTLIHYYYKR